MAISMGQFTIHDYNDAVTLTGYISTNIQKYQIYNPDTDTVSPDYTSTNLILTPSLYVINSTTDIMTGAQTAIQSVRWFRDNETTAITAGTNYAFEGTNNYKLKIKTNILTEAIPTATFRCEIAYTDPASSLVVTHIEDITINRVSSGGGVQTAIAATPNGNVFKNGTIDSLTATCELWHGSTIQTTGLTLQWYMMDSTVVTDQGGGVGWKKLTNTTNMYTGVTTTQMTVYNRAVDSLRSFKCVITDANHNNYQDFVTFNDYTDPIQVEVQSSAGDVFKNGNGSTVLTARLFQNGAEIDTAGTKYTYTWTVRDKDGNATQFDADTESPVSTKSGKTLTVDGGDVDVKATFIVEVNER